MRKQKRPKTEQRRDNPGRLKQYAAALFWLVHFILAVLEIIKLVNELTG